MIFWVGCMMAESAVTVKHYHNQLSKILLGKRQLIPQLTWPSQHIVSIGEVNNDYLVLIADFLSAVASKEEY